MALTWWGWSWSPWPADAGPGQPPPSIRGFIEPTAASIAFGREIWAEQGYHESSD